jgi:hypothetical protein
MVSPREQFNGQRFDPTYIVRGNQGERRPPAPCSKSAKDGGLSAERRWLFGERHSSRPARPVQLREPILQPGVPELVHRTHLTEHLAPVCVLKEAEGACRRYPAPA